MNSEYKLLLESLRRILYNINKNKVQNVNKIPKHKLIKKKQIFRLLNTYIKI